MELTFLGTSSGTPTRRRNVSGLALRDGGTWDLFDCGEATQHRLLATPLSLARMRRVFVSHVHGDHCFGLFGLLGSRSMERTEQPVTVFGPPGIEEMLTTVLRLSETHLAYPLDIVEVDPSGGVVVDADVRVEAVPLTHRVLSFAWSRVEPDRPGRLDIDAARAAGVPDGPLLGRLQRGEPVTLDDGQVVRPDAVLGRPRSGRHVVIAGDNSDPASLLERTGSADLLVHEATYTEPVVDRLGGDHGHSTARRVAAAAETAGIRSLALTHFSPRFVEPTVAGAVHSIEEVRREAEEEYSRTLYLARDLGVVELDSDGAMTVRDSTG